MTIKTSKIARLFAIFKEESKSIISQIRRLALWVGVIDLTISSDFVLLLTRQVQSDKSAQEELCHYFIQLFCLSDVCINVL